MMWNSSLLCWIPVVLGAVLVVGCGDGLSAEEQERLVGSYRLPQDGVSNDNAPVGPFCCTGRTLIVTDSQARTLGYAYFFGWDGQARNLSEEDSIAPDFYLQLSARSMLTSGNGEEVKDRIAFTGQEVRAGASRRQRVGALEYLVTIERVETLEFEGSPYFHMGTLELSVDVLRAKDAT